jgi:hypothetical protein
VVAAAKEEESTAVASVALAAEVGVAAEPSLADEAATTGATARAVRDACGVRPLREGNTTAGRPRMLGGPRWTAAAGRRPRKAMWRVVKGSGEAGNKDD